MTQCIFSAQGDFSCPKAPAAPPHQPAHHDQQHREAFRPAWVDADAKKGFWAERSGGGFPLPATEWQDRAHESHGWVAGAEGFAVAAPVQAQASCGSPGMAPCPPGQQCLNGRCAAAPTPIASATVAKK